MLATNELTNLKSPTGQKSPFIVSSLKPNLMFTQRPNLSHKNTYLLFDNRHERGSRHIRGPRYERNEIGCLGYIGMGIVLTCTFVYKLFNF